MKVIPTADLSNIRPSQWSGLFDWQAVEHAPDVDETWHMPLGSQKEELSRLGQESESIFPNFYLKTPFLAVDNG